MSNIVEWKGQQNVYFLPKICAGNREGFKTRSWQDIINFTGLGMRKGRSRWPSCIKTHICSRFFAGIAGSNPSGYMVCVSFECCVLSGRGFCEELVTRPEEFFWLCCVTVCDLENSRIRRSWPVLGCCARDEVDEGMSKEGRSHVAPRFFLNVFYSVSII